MNHGKGILDSKSACFMLFYMNVLFGLSGCYWTLLMMITGLPALPPRPAASHCGSPAAS